MTARSERQAARPRFVDGEPVYRSTAGGGKPLILRIARGARRGRPIEEGVTRGGIHRGGVRRRHLRVTQCSERDPDGR
jgi:hypothetical protein